jgi:aryl sulfotransferase
MNDGNVPRKIREMHNHHMDSTIWNDFVFRDDDIIITSYAKAGTTWLQQIIAQLLFNGEEDLAVAQMSPWIELRIPPREIKLPLVEAQSHRRFVKAHLPTDALVFSDRARYIYIGRDGRDIAWSLHNHHSMANAAWYAGLNKTPGRIGPAIEKPPASIKQYYRDWLDRDGHPLWPFWENVLSWWTIRSLPNVLVLHFSNLKQDLPGQIAKIAEFLGISIDNNKWESILLHCNFGYMKYHAPRSAPFEGFLWEGGSQSFFNKGTNGRWREILDNDDIEKYENRAVAELGSECACWLATGNMA